MKGNVTMKYPIKLYYYYKISRLKNIIDKTYMDYAFRSSNSSRNFEFDHLVAEDEKVVEAKKMILELKRKISRLN